MKQYLEKSGDIMNKSTNKIKCKECNEEYESTDTQLDYPSACPKCGATWIQQVGIEKVETQKEQVKSGNSLLDFPKKILNSGKGMFDFGKGSDLLSLGDSKKTEIQDKPKTINPMFDFGDTSDMLNLGVKKKKDDKDTTKKNPMFDFGDTSDLFSLSSKKKIKDEVKK